MYKTNAGQADITVIYDNVDITHLIVSAEWTGDIKQASRSLTVDVSNTINGSTQAVDFVKGKEISLSNGGEDLFKGVLFATDVNDKGQTLLTAYDENIYLTKSVDTRKFVNAKASDIVKRLCNDFGVPHGQIDDTGYVIPKLILRDKTLQEMIITALTVTEKQTGKRFFLCNKLGKLNLLERKTQISKWVLENGSNILGATYSRSIEEMKTQIKVIGGDQSKAPIVSTAKDTELISNFGIMQHLENVESDLTASQIAQRSSELLKQLGTIEDNANVDAIGITDIISGSAVYVHEQMSGIMGAYYVTSDYHTFEGGNHTMNVTLSATDDLPVMEYEPPAERKRRKEKKKKTSSNSGTSLAQVLKSIEEMGS